MNGTPGTAPGGAEQAAERVMACVPSTRQLRGADVTADAPLVAELAGLIEQHGTLYEWAAQGPQPRALRGRAPVFVAALPSGRDTLVVRHAWHGGLLAPVTGDRFRRPSRAPHEYAMSQQLRAAGVPTTTVLGFARYDAGLGTCRVDVVTRFVPDAYDLGMVAAGLVPGMQCAEALTATRRLLAQLAHVGVIHPDLNVKNILLTRQTDGALAAMIIDVDVIRLDARRDPSSTMQANVSRLIRSMRKWRTHFGCDVSEAMLTHFSNDALTSIRPRAHT
ncbi:MAG: hypothetical protein KA154_05265 [Gemmatimonadaceae bacterium]|nr:hypothetical protein [Gemmatimonadaceae bacterium]